MATDFLSALVDYWDSSSLITGANLAPLTFGTAPGALYPYSVITLAGSAVAHRNFTKTYVDVDRYRINVYTNDEDAAVIAGQAARAAMDTLVDFPLTFDDGEQVYCYRTGYHLAKNKQAGVEGTPFVWVYSLFYMVKIAHTRTT